MADINFPNPPLTTGQEFAPYMWDGVKWVVNTVSGGNAFIQAGSGAVTRTMQDKAREPVSVRDFGATGDGSPLINGTGTDARQAFLNAKAVSWRVLVPPGSYRIASDLSLDCELVLPIGAYICPDAGVTVTFFNPIYAGGFRIFGNFGTIRGLKQVYPEWWGAARDGTTDDAPAIKKAQICAESSLGSFGGGSTTIQFSKGTYAIGSQIVCTASNVNWAGVGSNKLTGTILRPLAAWTGPLVAIQIQRNSDLRAEPVGDFSSFVVSPQTPGSGPLVGIQIGKEGEAGTDPFHGGGYQQSTLFEDVAVEEFRTCWYICNSRFFHFRRCSGWLQTITDSTCLKIAATNQTTGDLDFYRFDAAATTARSLCLEILATGGKAVAGIGFHALVMYNGEVHIFATTSGQIFDIWFTPRWQLDATPGKGITIAADGAATFIRNVNFTGGHYAMSAPGGQAFTIYATNNARISTIQIDKNYFLGTTAPEVITVSRVMGISISGNEFADHYTNVPANSGAAVIRFTFCYGVHVEGNYIAGSYNGSTPRTNNFIINDGGSDYYVIRNNMSLGYCTNAAVVDSTPGTYKIIDGNLPP